MAASARRLLLRTVALSGLAGAILVDIDDQDDSMYEQLPRAMEKLQVELVNGTLPVSHWMFAEDYYSQLKARRKHALANATSSSRSNASEAAAAADSQTELGVPISTMKEFYPFTYLVLFMYITVLYAHQGVWVVLWVIAYLTSLSTITMSVNWVYHCGFNGPLRLSALHLGASGVVGLVAMAARKGLQGKAFVVPTPFEYAYCIMPISVTTVISLVLNNMALESISVAFSEIVASCRPICAVALVLVLGLPFNTRLLAPTGLVVMGASLSITGHIALDRWGLTMCAFSQLFGAAKSVLQQMSMTGTSAARIDEWALLAWSSLTCLGMTIVWAVLDGRELAIMAGRVHETWQPGAWFAIGLSCLNAVVFNASMLSVTKILGAVGSQVIGQSKAVLVVLGGTVIFGDRLSMMEVGGFVFILTGVTMFNIWSKQDQAKAAAERAAKEKAAEKSAGSETILDTEKVKERTTPSKPNAQAKGSAEQNGDSD
eukprot:TRINITY_DN41706_c0_g1_i1.p1 TRINITY_DN41706_c0_g1~~TRINITY_DN41706_c0_g1_i1.p1  ORF type:complete len:487 (-),score=135.57 TRINITY_DN41706_c0_g1_i1:312-1772(-)